VKGRRERKFFEWEKTFFLEALCWGGKRKKGGYVRNEREEMCGKKEANVEALAWA